jgi:SAM-dependent methyltransferase
MTRGPDPERARRRYDHVAAGCDRSLAPLRRVQERLRTDAVRSLVLTPGPGATVLDIGCGTGASFHRVVDAVGPGGRVVGVDQSKGMLDNVVALAMRRYVTTRTPCVSRHSVTDGGDRDSRVVRQGHRSILGDESNWDASGSSSSMHASFCRDVRVQFGRAADRPDRRVCTTC